jgi:anaerobic nitric oxide reductase transcription regulator
MIAMSVRRTCMLWLRGGPRLSAVTWLQHECREWHSATTPNVATIATYARRLIRFECSRFAASLAEEQRGITIASVTPPSERARNSRIAGAPARDPRELRANHVRNRTHTLSRTSGSHPACLIPATSLLGARGINFDDMLEPLVEIASDLCASMAAEERYQRLVALARRMIPAEVVALLRLKGAVLIPVVADGLESEALATHFAPKDHPRLATILAASRPVRFDGHTIPDPFDGLFAERSVPSRVHACVGAPLMIEGEAIGALVLDGVDPKAFERVDDDMVAMLAALAGAAIHTVVLVDALEEVATKNKMVVREVISDSLERGGGEVLGTSAAMIGVRREVELLARSDLTGLITGETGVGKELAVHSIHARSRRCDQPLINVNCAALPESLAESELFGHVRGAFTGAQDHRAGKFEVADGGTIFLDEIGELPLSIQPKLLRVLQSGEVQRVGSDRTLRVDVRVIAATNRDLAEEVRAGRFRGDLYYRLSVYPLHIPPLRDRRDDIGLLSGHLLDLARARLCVGQLRLTKSAREALREYDWPGNVRELEHTLLRAALRASEGRRSETIVIDAVHLGLGAAAATMATPLTATTDEIGPSASEPLRKAVDAFTSKLITSTIARCDNNWAEAARRLGLQRGNLHRLAVRLGIRPGSNEPSSRAKPGS